MKYNLEVQTTAVKLITQLIQHLSKTVWTTTEHYHHGGRDFIT